MSHKVEWVQTCTIDDNQVWAMISAQWKGEFLDVYKVNLSTGKAYARDGNIVYKNLAGYFVDFPDEIARASWYYGYGQHKVELCDYVEVDRIRAIEYGYCMRQTDDRIRETILKYQPELKYLINKLEDGMISRIFDMVDIIQTYKEHPESENLFASGFYKIGMNKSLYKLGKAKKKLIINFLKQLNIYTYHDYKLVEIQQALKLNIDAKLWQDVYNFFRPRTEMILIFNDYSMKIYRYCKNKNIDYSYYKDIINMVRQTGHNEEDPYYAFPNNPVAMHNRLQKQIENQRAATEKAKLAVLPKIAKKNLKEPLALSDGYQLFIPTTYEQFEACKELLHQCLLSADYIGKMAKGRSLIIMIWKDGKPSSTAEIDYKGKLLQFYGNEWNRSECKPKKEEYEILDNFMATFKPKRINKYLPA